MSEITSASQEQTAGIEQISQAISQMNDVTQQNAALVEQAAVSASLQQQSGILADNVGVFRLDGSNESPCFCWKPDFSPTVARIGTVVAAAGTDWEEF